MDGEAIDDMLCAFDLLFVEDDNVRGRRYAERHLLLLNLLGTFDTIVTQQLPAVHPQCSVALRIVFSKVEEGQHKVKMNFVDEDGRFVMPSIDIPVDVMLPPDASIPWR